MHRWCMPTAITTNEPSFWKPYTSLMPTAGATLDAARLRVFREVVRRGSLSAAAGMLRAQDSDLSYSQIRSILKETVDPDAALAGKTVTGGRLNLARALGMAG